MPDVRGLEMSRSTSGRIRAGFMALSIVFDLYKRMRTFEVSILLLRSTSTRRKICRKHRQGIAVIRTFPDRPAQDSATPAVIRYVRINIVRFTGVHPNILRQAVSHDSRRIDFLPILPALSDVTQFPHSDKSITELSSINSSLQKIKWVFYPGSSWGSLQVG
jgi:hypothetical protein